MRLAIISDIHSNLEALTSALEMIDRQPVDDIFCLGDIVGYGANPNECLDLVKRRCTTILLGNHDAAAVDLSITEKFTTNARIAAYWTNKVLHPDNKQFLKHVPLTKTMDDLRFVHASPYEPEVWHYVYSYFDARLAFKSFQEKLCFVGHSHVPVIFSEEGETRRIIKERRYIINVGSIGQPRDGNPQLSFGIFDTKTWEYANIRGEYDREIASKKILQAGLPRALADRLMVGT